MKKMFLLLTVLVTSNQVFGACETSSQQLQISNTINCQGDNQNQVVYFKYSAKSDSEYYITVEYNTCDKAPNYEWQELDVQGNVIKSNDARESIIMSKGKNYQLKATINDTCTSYSAGFQLEKLY